jgi:3-methyladenine DNA glycosylase AlkD
MHENLSQNQSFKLNTQLLPNSFRDLLEMCSQAHDEVLGSLSLGSDPVRGSSMKSDGKGENFICLGTAVPEIRSKVKRGFSFLNGKDAHEIAKIWNSLFLGTPVFEIRSAAIMYYALMGTTIVASLWKFLQPWSAAIDNWDHADALCGVYSNFLRNEFESCAHNRKVYVQLKKLTGSEENWSRRIEVVSLKHYSGKNCIFLPFEDMIAVLNNVLGDDDLYVQRGLG